MRDAWRRDGCTIQWINSAVAFRRVPSTEYRVSSWKVGFSSWENRVSSWTVRETGIFSAQNSNFSHFVARTCRLDTRFPGLEIRNFPNVQTQNSHGTFRSQLDTRPKVTLNIVRNVLTKYTLCISAIILLQSPTDTLQCMRRMASFIEISSRLTVSASLIKATGTAGKFSIVPLLLNVGSGVGLLAVVSSSSYPQLMILKYFVHRRFAIFCK